MKLPLQIVSAGLPIQMDRLGGILIAEFQKRLFFLIQQQDYNLASQHLCEKLGMRREGLFLEFISFVNNPDGTPRYENTVQYAILKKEWDRQQSQ